MKSWCVGVTFVFSCAVLLTVVLVPLSLRRVNYDEVAIRYDKISRTLGDTILREGLHDIGPSGELLVLKTTQRDAAYHAFDALTSDGLTVRLDVVVTYAIVVADIFYIFDEYGSQEDHDDYIRNVCAQRMTDVSVGFSASQYFLDRQSFQLTLQNSIHALFTQQNSHATLYFAQVVNVDLPSGIAAALLSTTVAIQDIANANGERPKDIQQAQISLNLAAANANLTVLGGTLEASKIDQQTLQTVLSIRSRLSLRSYTFSNISAALGKGGAFFVESYLKPLVVSEQGSRSIISL